jgi:GT2 family glycosyltransferase
MIRATSRCSGTKLGFSGTGNLAMHRNVYEAVGPFSGIDIAEDMDWGRRANAAGFPPRWAHGMCIYHPARPDLASLRVKWRRHIAHAWTEHRLSGRPIWPWVVKAIALPISTPIDGIKLLLAPRLGGFRNRLRGLNILAKVRLMRSAEMLRVISAVDETAATHWHADPT